MYSIASVQETDTAIQVVLTRPDEPTTPDMASWTLLLELDRDAPEKEIWINGEKRAEPPYAALPEQEKPTSGEFGYYLTWRVDEAAGVLTISGIGRMEDWLYSATPWYAFADQIKTAVIESGATEIGEYTFGFLRSLTSVTIPDSVTSIGSSAFSGCTSLTDVTIPDSVTDIGSSAFADCTRLTKITLPAGLTMIPYAMLNGCS
ncbi:MAG: leucine-rich repeat domain-containing protein, partial [Oscillospiraceae bacterium]|nr:leucine-rich repeat domain-containing protein [Oscillospiraceae bacterium]